MAPLDEFDQLSRFWNLKLTSRKKRIGDNDFSDFLNWRLTPVTLLITAFLLMIRNFVTGDMVQCWTPPEFSKDWEAYAERYCWTQGTYTVPPYLPLPSTASQREESKINYYQWTPFILGLEAFMFFFPHMVWTSLRTLTGIRIKTLVQSATDASNQGAEKREEYVQKLARHILLSLGIDLDSNTKHQNNYRRKGFFAKQGWYVCALYIGVKLLYLLNIFGQFLLLQSFLGTKYNFYGLEILNDLVQGRDWMETSHFPRVTMCDFTVRALGQPRKYSLQCVLVINLFNEKIFIFLWFWFAFVAILTLCSLLTWAVWFVAPRWRQGSVTKCLDNNDDFKKRNFTDQVLRPDGQFLMKMIGVNVGEPIMYDIINAMWDELKKDKEGEADEGQGNDKEVGDIKLKGIPNSSGEYE